ncbi:MAG: class A beta-lactamase-related serine hydrolase [Lysobacteraceae bacterium]|nr:MAG: class A beta-lactamase-related serine hydrolase [Xanthomonadaceae bacterium]
MHDRRRRARFSAMLALLVWTGASCADDESGASPETLAKLDAVMTRKITGETPGCAVGILGEGVEVMRAYGQADLERGVANTVDSVFNVGSVAKQVTAAAVLTLAADGKLALDDHARKYLPELPMTAQPITIDDLLSHTSGLRDFRATDWMLGRDALPQNNRDVLAYAARQRDLNHAPGASFLYTNTGYVLLALIVERVSGRGFADFTRERLFAPAGMTRTQWEDDVRDVVAGRSIGYTQVEWPQDGTPARFQQWPTARHTTGHGGLLTTVGDMQRWNAALSNATFGSDLAEQMNRPARLRSGVVLEYARGVFVGRHRGFREIQHSGYTGTYTAWVGRYPEAGLSVSVLCNGDGDEVDPREIVDLFLPTPSVPASAPASEASAEHVPTADRRDLSAFSGVYRDPADGRLSLWDFPKDAQMRDDAYAMGSERFEFDPAQPGRVVREQYGNRSTWVRLPVWQPSAEALAEFAGRFASAELLAGYEVTFDGRQLSIGVLGLSESVVPLQPRAPDVFERTGLLIAFKRDAGGRVSGLALAPNQLHEIAFARTATR